MKRFARWLLPIALVSFGVGVWIRLLRPAGGDARNVPTFELEEVPFTRTVNAEGVLKPVKTTVINAPGEAREAMMIAWMLDDGDPVKKGEVVIRFDSDELGRKLADGEGQR